jgi:hypothetical protein
MNRDVKRGLKRVTVEAWVWTDFGICPVRLRGPCFPPQLEDMDSYKSKGLMWQVAESSTLKAN